MSLAIMKKIEHKIEGVIIVISAKVGIENKVHVLKMDADDYITKPFHQEEVLARVEVQLRKNHFQQLQRVEMGCRGLK